MAQPQFDDYVPGVGMGAQLQCPSCGSSYLTHQRVEVFERKEDNNRGLHVTVIGELVQTDTLMEGNPSRRRHGIAIHFVCEGGSAQPVLTIAQHKGYTFMDIAPSAPRGSEEGRANSEH